MTVVDVNNLTAEQQKIFVKNHHDFAYIKQPQYADFFTFAFCEYDKKKNEEVIGRIISERAFFKDYKSACDYFTRIFETDFIDYACFQVERGEKGGNLHLQGFMHYRKSMDFGAVRRIFPGIHLDQTGGSNFDNREYCKKEKTRVEGFEFFEVGQLVEEGQRLDNENFKKDMVNLDIPLAKLIEDYPYQAMMNLAKIKALREELKLARFENEVRNVRVTYIYGASRAGKTTYVRRVLKYAPKDVAKVGKYNTTGQFDAYKGQDVLLFDEFKGQLSLTEMNDYTEGEPLNFHGRNFNRVAMYTKVFIISNYSLDELYRKERQQGDEPSYKAFCNRIHEIIYMPQRNHYIWQKGRPSSEVIATLSEQCAIVDLLPFEIDQITIEEVM